MLNIPSGEGVKCFPVLKGDQCETDSSAAISPTQHRVGH